MATIATTENTDFTAQPGFVRIKVIGGRIRVFEKAGANYFSAGDVPEQPLTIESGVVVLKITEADTSLKWAALSGAPTVVVTQTA